MENLSISLLITVIGMGLVFASIIFLWWLMEALMRLTSIKGDVQASVPPARPEEDPAEQDRRRRAAAAAVALALAQEQEAGVHEFPLPATAVVSPWQGVMRANNLKQRGSVR
jgi:Na+-transporting methylmalonyl-CoA/oxaloacetate decarboxylase gamma subunit